MIPPPRRNNTTTLESLSLSRISIVDDSDTDSRFSDSVAGLEGEARVQSSWAHLGCEKGTRTTTCQTLTFVADQLEVDVQISGLQHRSCILRLFPHHPRRQCRLWSSQLCWLRRGISHPRLRRAHHHLLRRLHPAATLGALMRRSPQHRVLQWLTVGKFSL